MKTESITIQNVVSDEQCYQMIRELRWSDGVRCPHCQSNQVIKRGKAERQGGRQRYECKACRQRFDDVTGTVLSGHHQPLKVWMIALYLMGLNLSNRQIALELGLSESSVQQMTEQLRQGLEEKKHLSSSVVRWKAMRYMW